MKPGLGWRRLCQATLCLAVWQGPMRADAQVRVVNVVPRMLSGESFQNSEPTLAVNPADPSELAMGAFAEGVQLCRRRMVTPLLVSVDSGATWHYVCKFHVDSSTANLTPGDMQLRFSADGETLYAAYLWPTFPPLTMRVMRSEHGSSIFSPATLTPMAAFPNADQPHLAAALAPNGPPLFVGASYRDSAATATWLGTAGVAVLTESRASRDVAAIPLESRQAIGPNFAIRLAAHADGTVYAVFYSPRDGDNTAVDVTVVRRDPSADLRTAFTALSEAPARDTASCSGTDGVVGVRAARCRALPLASGSAVFGEQRRMGSNLSIAVDPRDSKRLWIAWADSTGPEHYRLHVRASSDGGRTWGGDAVSVTNATNPALAVASDGTVGFLFQQLTGPASAQRWATRLLLSADEFTSVRSLLLADTPVRGVAREFDPYLGDYLEMFAVGRTFFGVFSANNTPDLANFPAGVRYNRNVDLRRRRLVDTAGRREVAPSIDPFFFSVGPEEHADCASLIGRGDATAATRRAEIGCR